MSPGRAPRPCPHCGALTAASRACPRCAPVLRAKAPGRYPPGERARMRRAVEHWISLHGGLCPGYGRAAHPVLATELTADHLYPRSLGGTGGPLGVLCRSCNSRKGARGVVEDATATRFPDRSPPA